MYLRLLSRHATDAETKKLLAYVNETKDPAKGYGDVMWALVNSAEFLFNH
jgi:hypothetical protein